MTVNTNERPVNAVAPTEAATRADLAGVRRGKAEPKRAIERNILNKARPRVYFFSTYLAYD